MYRMEWVGMEWVCGMSGVGWNGCEIEWVCGMEWV